MSTDLGDCAVTGNVPAMRNKFKTAAVFDRAYKENAALQQQNPSAYLPTLLDRVTPVHEAVRVDLFLPGCPPPADVIYHVITDLLAGRTPEPQKLTRFGK